MYKCYVVCSSLIRLTKNLHLQFHLYWEKTLPTLPYWVGMWCCCPLWLSKSQYIILSIKFQLDCIFIGMSALFIVHCQRHWDEWRRHLYVLQCSELICSPAIPFSQNFPEAMGVPMEQQIWVKPLSSSWYTDHFWCWESLWCWRILTTCMNMDYHKFELFSGTWSHKGRILTHILSGHVGMLLGKIKLNWSWHSQGR